MVVFINENRHRNLGFPVSPRSWGEIALLANRVRQIMGCDKSRRFPIEKLELLMPSIDPEFYLLAEASSKMEVEGMAKPWDRCIILREDIMEKLESGDPRARFTLAHELGHYIMHANERNCFARINRKTTWPIYQDSEAQANQFAARILMPISMIRICKDSGEIEEQFGVSGEAAKLNYDKHCRRG